MAFRRGSAAGFSSSERNRRRLLLLTAVALGGFASLGWELVWQLETSLAIGVSSQATAIVIAVTMGGMAAGTLLAGNRLEKRAVDPFVVYAVMEAVVGLCGLGVGRAFDAAAAVDVAAWRQGIAGSALVHLAAVAVCLGPPSMAMGATVPLLGLIGRREGVALSLLYGVNTLGAAIGTLFMAFVLMPALGLSGSVLTIGAVNLSIATAFFLLGRSGERVVARPRVFDGEGLQPSLLVAVFLTGFAVFALEVVFFRAMRAAFLSTTFTFALMLASVLLALSAGAAAARLLRGDRAAPGMALAAGGVCVLLATPIVERIDVLTRFYLLDVRVSNFLLSLALLAPAVTALGAVFPLTLERVGSPRQWGLVHACNAVGAILGALVAAWILLPVLGMAPSAWLVGVVLVVAGFVASPSTRGVIAGAGAVALLIAMVQGSGIGRSRVMGMRGHLAATEEVDLLAHRETPDFSVSVVSDRKNGMRALYIDGFNASSAIHGVVGYMAWMGRLPMMRSAHPDDALVICFGRGETVHALLTEGPRHVDVVDISAAVFDVAVHFRDLNEGALEDPRVRPIVMDGRSWLRRTERFYDVLTLEPMPPTFAGVNALYSREFYELASSRLRDGGTIAQWVPYHLLSPDHAAAITRTFLEVFPDTVLWLYRPYTTGILVGRKGTDPVRSRNDWPGLAREAKGRELDAKTVLDAVILDAAGLARYTAGAEVITDDNQRLAYGWDTMRHDVSIASGSYEFSESLKRIEAARAGGAAQ